MTAGPVGETVTGIELDAFDDEALGDAVASLLAPATEALGTTGTVLLLPDTGYPYHPSTGAVTNPDLVWALAAELRRSVDPDRVVVGVAGDGQVDDGKVAELLGYVSRGSNGEGATAAHGTRDGTREVEVITRKGSETDDRSVQTHLGRVDAAVPDLFDEATVVVVPSLRVAPEVRLAGGLVTLGRWLCEGAPTAREAAAAASFDPAMTLLDGTYAFVGHPLRTGVLLGGPSAPTLDATTASLLGWDTGDISYLPESAMAAGIDGIDTEELERSLPDRPSVGPTGPSDAMGTVYRMYAKATGDVVPPQFLPTDE